MRLPLIVVYLASFLVSFCLAAPRVTLTSNSLLDANGVFFVSYDGVVNVNSFQLSGVLTYSNYQFAAWYTSSRAAVLARRQLPSGAWSTLQLPHTLSASDSHNVIALGVSPAEGKIHVAMDCHSSTLYYTSSEAGLATSGASWVASRFAGITTTLAGLNIGTHVAILCSRPLTVTYPQFVVTSDNLLQFVYRSGVSGNGATQLAEYNGGKWNNVGSWASASGTYTSTNGVKSTARNLYIHGFTYRSNRLHVTGTWREQTGGVSCSGGGLTNHDTTYFYSDDKGRTWKNSAGSSVGTSGSNPVNVNSGGIIVDSLNADHGLMNQESQAVDSGGQIHAIISYVPGRFTQCVTSYQNDRIAYARPFHVYRSSSGTFTKVEIPFAINSVGRSQIVMDNADNVYVVLPYVRVVTASKSSGWTDWTLAYDGVAAGLNAFGEVTVDRARVSSNVLSVLYQVKSTGTTPSAVRVVDFNLNT
ncbi:hypothetical protein D9615_006668 [Tricholomella constricta]|uniref:Tat pathway signal sequence domain protein n=1 Tax=Tricholomella constricta TaxID=117010 RepID=A0A8H5H770_9AGAR|nr:hypothetical protein D9615_006668 [Tricholomella constricta]